jgi:hypothetical protein
MEYLRFKPRAVEKPPSQEKKGQSKMKKAKCITAEFLDRNHNIVFETSFKTYTEFNNYLIRSGMVLLKVNYPD